MLTPDLRAKQGGSLWCYRQVHSARIGFLNGMLLRYQQNAPLFRSVWADPVRWTVNDPRPGQGQLDMIEMASPVLFTDVQQLAPWGLKSKVVLGAPGGTQEGKRIL